MPQYITKQKSEYIRPDEKLSRHSCIVPFQHIEIHSSGLISACCHTWLPTWVGNLLEDSAQEVIDNADRKLIQENMRNGVFDHCNDQCPQLNSLLNSTAYSSNSSETYWDIIPSTMLDRKLATSPIYIGFSYDLSCNLQCPSCRNELIVWRTDDINDKNGQRIKLIHSKVKELVHLLLNNNKLVFLTITGSGDAFASPLYWDYLVELANNPIPPNLRIQIKTNGVMMTPEKWDEIKPLWGSITFVEVSVDAATEDTYKIVRKNGNFNKLKKNLEVFDEMVYNKSFSRLDGWQTNIIVQRDNFSELKQFMEWQLTFKSKPLIWTNLIAQWYHMTDDNYTDKAVWMEGHPMRDKFLEILKDPIFINPQIKLGNLNSFI